MYATLNGIRLAYSDRGQRHTQALLLIHGFPLNRHIWDAQLEGLSDQFRVIAPDLRGAGDSEIPPAPYHVDQYADDLAALLGHLNISQAVIAGLSMGGYAAFALWRRHPQRVRGLILLDTRPDPDSPEARANRDAAMTRVQRDGAEPFAREQLTRLLAPVSLENTRLAGKALAIMATVPVPGIVGTLYSLRDRPDSRPTLPTIKVPTLVIVGDQDQVTPPSLAQDMAHAIPGAGLVTVRQAGHLSPLEQPRSVNRAIRAFLNGLATNPVADQSHG